MSVVTFSNTCKETKSIIMFVPGGYVFWGFSLLIMGLREPDDKMLIASWWLSYIWEGGATQGTEVSPPQVLFFFIPSVRCMPRDQRASYDSLRIRLELWFLFHSHLRFTRIDVQVRLVLPKHVSLIDPNSQVSKSFRQNQNTVKLYIIYYTISLLRCQTIYNTNY